jgi:hypothetical protein
MRNRLPMRSTHVSLAMSMCAFTLLYCAVNIRPSFAQNQNNQDQGNLDWRYHGNACRSSCMSVNFALCMTGMHTKDRLVLALFAWKLAGTLFALPTLALLRYRR